MTAQGTRPYTFPKEVAFEPGHFDPLVVRDNLRQALVNKLAFLIGHTLGIRVKHTVGRLPMGGVLPVVRVILVHFQHPDFEADRLTLAPRFKADDAEL